MWTNLNSLFCKEKPENQNKISGQIKHYEKL